MNCYFECKYYKIQFTIFGVMTV